MAVTPLRLPSQGDLERVFDAVGVTDWEQMRGKRILLTGGTGFVGKWLLTTLLHADRRLGLGCRVFVLSRDPDAFLRHAAFLADNSSVVCFRGDIKDFSFEFEACDLIIHAATDVAVGAAPLDVFDSCVAGTRRVLDLAMMHETARVLLVSSGAVYGAQPAGLPALPETYAGAPDVRSLRSGYGEGKRVSEWLGAAYSELHGLDVRTARCFAFVGPYQPLDGHFAMANFLRDAMAGQPIVIRGDGTAIRSYLYASDMAAWLWAITLRGEPNGVYNVGGREAVSIAQLAHRVATVLGSSASISIERQASPGLSAERYVPDVDKATNELGLPPSIELDAAIRSTADWHCTH